MNIEKSPMESKKQKPVALQLIAFFKFFCGVFLLVIAIGIFKLLRNDIADQLNLWIEQLHVDADNRLINSLIVKVTSLDPKLIRRAGIGSFIYSAVLLVEGIGLFLNKRWAEYLTVIATTALLPLEIYEVIEKISWLKVAILLINLAAAAYLIRRLSLKK